jgi:hypothetical protein
LLLGLVSIVGFAIIYSVVAVTDRRILVFPPTCSGT